jgi:SPP1 gp7 family putative phage head morphogenesis protein
VTKFERLRQRLARKKPRRAQAPAYPAGAERMHLATLRAIHADVVEGILVALDRVLLRADSVRNDGDGDEWARAKADARTAVNQRLGKIRQGFTRTADLGKRALTQAIGIPLVLEDTTLGALADDFVSRHVHYITKMTDEEIYDIGVMVREGTDSGLSYTELKRQVMDRTGVGRVRAELIARTEISSVNAEINKARFNELGVTKAKWITGKDARVRPAHRAMEGVEFDVNDPPHVGGGIDELGHKIPDEGNHLPGQWFNCRCRSAPVIDWLAD